MIVAGGRTISAQNTAGLKAYTCKCVCGKRVRMTPWTQHAIGSVIGRSMSKAAVFSLGLARRICFVRKDTRFLESHMVTISCTRDQQND